MENNKQSMDVWKTDLKSMTLQTIKEKLYYSINAARTISCSYIKKIN